MASDDFDDIMGASRRITAYLERMRDTPQIQEVQNLREELARERNYREFLERILGYSLSSIADCVASEENPREIIAAHVFTLLEKLQEFCFGRFINTTPGTNLDAFLRESFESLDEKHKEASLSLGISHYYGIGVDADRSKCYHIFKDLYEGGYSEARSWLARCLFFGVGVEANKEEAIRLVRLDADEGKPEAQRLLGLFLYDRGDESSFAEAARYFKMAADHMDTDAQCLYGYCLKDGEGVRENNEEAARYFKMAADQGNSDAQICYALILDSREALFDEHKKSDEYFRMAVSRGNATALKLFGVNLLGTPQEARSLEYFKMAADMGDIGALCIYGNALLEQKSVPEDVQQGAQCMKTCADRGSILGAFAYAQCLRDGTGVAQDRCEAARYFKICADTNEPPFQIAYGICLYDADGVTLDRNGAAQYFKMAADQKNPDGQCLYGLCLFGGDGVDMNKKEAVRYFRAAADQGSELGKTLLKQNAEKTLHVFQGDVLRKADISLTNSNIPGLKETNAMRTIFVDYDNWLDAVGLGRIRSNRWERLMPPNISHTLTTTDAGQNPPTPNSDVRHDQAPIQDPKFSKLPSQSERKECQVA